MLQLACDLSLFEELTFLEGGESALEDGLCMLPGICADMTLVTALRHGALPTPCTLFHSAGLQAPLKGVTKNFKISLIVCCAM